MYLGTERKVLSFQTGFNHVNVAVVCAILESISSLKPWLDTTEPRCLKLLTVSCFCPLVQYLSFFCEAFSWMILDSSSFPFFHRSQVFHQLVCPLAVVLAQILFNLTTLFSYPVFPLPFSCTSWCCSHPCISQILQVWIFSFSVLSLCRIDQEFLQVTQGFFFWWCLPGISLAVSVTTVLK